MLLMSKNRLQLLGLKRRLILFLWIAPPITQKRVMTSGYSPCADTPPAATALVTTVDVALLIF